MTENTEFAQNMTKREYFAAQALIGFYTRPVMEYVDPITMAKAAVQQADALIAELNEA